MEIWLQSNRKSHQQTSCECFGSKTNVVGRFKSILCRSREKSSKKAIPSTGFRERHDSLTVDHVLESHKSNRHSSRHATGSSSISFQCCQLVLLSLLIQYRQSQNFRIRINIIPTPRYQSEQTIQHCFKSSERPLLVNALRQKQRLFDAANCKSKEYAANCSLRHSLNYHSPFHLHCCQW